MQGLRKVKPPVSVNSGGVMTVRPCLRTAIFRLVTLLLILGLAFLILEYISYRISPALDGALAELLFIVVVSLPLICAIVLVRPIIMLFDSYLQATPHHVKVCSGRCSLKQKWHEFPYENLLGVEVDQSILDRLLGVGTVYLNTAVRGTPELLVRGVRRPTEIAEIIANRIDTAKLAEQRN